MKIQMAFPSGEATGEIEGTTAVEDGKLEIADPGIVHLGTITSGLEDVAQPDGAMTITKASAGTGPQR